MRLSFPYRLTLYLLALMLAASGLVAVGIVTYHERNHWAGQLNLLHAESVDIPQAFRTNFLQLNVQRLLFAISGEAGDREQVARSADAVAKALQSLNTPQLVPESQAVLNQFSTEFETFRKDLDVLLAGAGQAAPQTQAQLRQRIQQEGARILELDKRLGQIQLAAMDEFVSRARSEMDPLFLAIYVLMAELLVCMVALGWVTWRDLVRPLRREVIGYRAQLEQQQKLLERQEKLNLLGWLAAGVAHEVRNPLNSIKARLYLQRRALGDSSPGLADNRFIDEEVDRLEGVVRKTLDFARPAAPAFQRLQPAAALRPICDLLVPSLRQRQIQLHTDFQPGTEIFADPVQLQQAVLNLVKNAAESIGQTGTIWLRTRPDRSRRDGRACVAVEVQDTGRGLSHETQQRLFDLFIITRPDGDGQPADLPQTTVADRFFTTKADGTGLGLSITARIVEEHGGTIECLSQPNRGATFRLLLPIPDSAPVAAAPAASQRV